jgi:hypothetical protein
MPYEIIQPPFTLKFREMTNPELKEYYRWYLAMIKIRIGMLTEEVKQSTIFQAWRPDETPSSLDKLGEWFSAQIEVRQRTPDESHEIELRSRHSISIPKEELTNRTFSLAIDIGMYFSQVLIKNHPQVRWEQIFGNKKSIDYGQPVLVGFGAMPFNPVQMLVSQAYGLATKKKTGKCLRELYEIWSEMIQVDTKNN